jgi:hypothetical protein
MLCHPTAPEIFSALSSSAHTVLEAWNKCTLLQAPVESTSTFVCLNETLPCLWFQIEVSTSSRKCFAICALRPKDGELTASVPIKTNELDIIQYHSVFSYTYPEFYKRVRHPPWRKLDTCTIMYAVNVFPSLVKWTWLQLYCCDE